MTDSRKKNGFVGIANQIWDEVIRRDFTKRQKDILLFIWRLSYGCNQEIAIIPMLKDFALCGVGKGHIGAELKHLENCKVIARNNNEYRFNENYDYWQISPVKGWDSNRFDELIHTNLINAKKTKKQVTETGTEQDEGLEGNPAAESYQNGDSPDAEELPKQEPIQEDSVTETVTENGNQLLKQEPPVTETVTVTPLEPIQGAASGALKDTLKTLKDKDIKDMVILDFELFWNSYPKKVAKKQAQNMWDRAIKEKVKPELLIQCSQHYAQHCSINRTESNFIMHGSTFLNPKNERYADFTEAPKITAVVPVASDQSNTRSSRNKSLLQRRMEDTRNGQSTGTEHFGGSGYSLPHGRTD
ncbi:phage replication protein O [Paenibacillus sp. RU5A]|nr:phage replication protein O [Paenibacillus sp. RU5A]SOC58511.1 phage replication protein O [Paenibacillus sp. RU26A]SOC67563.1 phage replication protein O [Paenibacillus sp. RU5M]